MNLEGRCGQDDCVIEMILIFLLFFLLDQNDRYLSLYGGHGIMQKSKIPFSKCAGIFVAARRSQINYCRPAFESARGIDSKKLILSEQYI